jgi:3'(2'), 5'-bisphosphate nucleotidase
VDVRYEAYYDADTLSLEAHMMKSRAYVKELQIAVNAVAEAAKLCEAVGDEARSASLEKNDRSPVTIADYGSQALIQRALTEAFPGVRFISEEDAGALRDPKNAALLERLVDHVNRVRPGSAAAEILSWIDSGKADQDPDTFWTLDPIDGTKGFLRGDQYAISLCMVISGELQVAALGCPRLDTGKGDGETGVIFSAVKGSGALQQDTPASAPVPISVSDVTDLTQIRFTESVEKAHSSHSDSARIAEHLGIVAEPVRIDSQAKYAAVSRGDGEVYLRLPRDNVYREKIWDHAGGALVAMEAGGKVTDIKGRPLNFNKGYRLEENLGVIVTNGHVHDAVLEAIKTLGIGNFD